MAYEETGELCAYGRTGYIEEEIKTNDARLVRRGRLGFSYTENITSSSLA